MTHADDDDGRRRPSWYSTPEESPAAHEAPAHQQSAGSFGSSPPQSYSPPPHYSPPPGYSPTPGFSPTPGTDELNRMHSIDADQAQSSATAALVLSIIGFFTMPFIFGPLAIWQASKARRLGHAATAGWVLGWICTLWGVAVIALPILFFLVVAFLAGV